MTSTYNNFAWTQEKPGVWSRDVDEAEQFYSALVKAFEGTGRMMFAITGHLSLSVNARPGTPAGEAAKEVDHALKCAWVALRHAHPAIASQIHYNSETGSYIKTCNVGDGDWLERTFVPISTNQTGEEWANSDPPAPPSLTLFVVNRPPMEQDGIVYRDLVIRSPHDVIDGIGTLMLLNNYVLLAADIYEQGNSYALPSPSDISVESFSPPYRVAACVPATPTKTVLAKLEATKAAAAAAAEAGVQENRVEAIGVPFKKGALLPGKHQRVAITFSKDQTARLLAACKSMNVTVTHAFHAAIAIAVRDLQESTEPRRVQYISYILRNERERCIAPYNDNRHPAGVYHSVSGDKLVVEMDLSCSDTNRREEFSRVVGQIRDFYNNVRNDSDHYAIAPFAWAAATPKLPADPSEVIPIPPPMEPAPVSLSSMGIVDKIITPREGAFSVSNPWVTGEELKNGLGLFLGTFKGELVLSAAYNDVWHDRDVVRNFLKRCEDIVFGGLNA
ncbi:hypothetical protein BGZ63DRAFT_395212 [Mariannaea sp. PMI_226]|nr:hypothetical protein BGZ63DRAFT_395212 [Mariannaea sp. PMI_226]